MKKRLLSVALLMGTSFVAQAQVGIGTATPNKSAELSVVASNRGLLIPNVALSDIKDEKTITNGNEESLLVFNTNTTPSKDATLSVTPGYYYWHIDRWHRMTSESDIPQIVVNQFENILNLDGDKVKNIIQGLFSETLTVVEYDPATGALKYIDEKGQPTVIDIAGAVKNFETVTKIEGNKEDGTFTFIDEAGNSTTVNIGDYVKYHETLTTLVKQRPGLYTYTNEHGKTQDITVVSDLIQVIENKTDLDLYNVLKQLVKVEQSLTQLVYNATTNKLTYIDEANKENELDIDTLVKANQNNVKVIAGTNITVTEDSSKKNLVTYTLDVPHATKDTPGVVRPGAGLEVSSDGTLNVDYTDLNSELANGTILSSSINVMMDKGSVHPTFSDVTLEIAPGKQGQVLVTGKDANGNAVTTWEDKAGTTNTLELEADPKADNYNKLTSSVNGVESTIDLNNAVNTDMLQSSSVTADKVDESVAGNGLVKNEITGALDVDYTDLNSELANGTILSSSINVMMDKGSVHPTFSDVTLEIAAGEEGQVLTSVENADGSTTTVWKNVPSLNLEGDVVLENGKTVVEGIQNTPVSPTPPSKDGQVLVYDETSKSWIPGNTDVKDLAGAKDLTAIKDGDLERIKITNGTGTTLINTSLDVNEEDLRLQNIGGTLNVTQIQKGNAGDILTTVEDKEGNTSVEWKPAPTDFELTLEGDVTLDKDGKTVVGGIQNVPVSKDKPTTDGQTLVYETDKDGNGQWVPGMPDVSVENILNAKNLTTDGKISIATDATSMKGDSEMLKRGAVLIDTHLSITKGSISTEEITDGTIKPEDIAKGGNDKVLGTDEQGNPGWMDKSTLMVEPWFVQKGETTDDEGETVKTGGDKATLNTQNIYQSGAVAIKKETGIEGADLDVAGAVRGAAAADYEEVGENSVALGFFSIAKGNQSIALGTFATVYGSNSISLGYNTINEKAKQSIAIGDTNVINAALAIGVGNNLQVNSFESLAMGYGSITTTQRETVMGSYNAILNGKSSLEDSKTEEYKDPNAIHFQIGNGVGSRTSATEAGSASTAFAMLKNGNTGIGIVGLTDEAAKPTATLDVGAGKPDNSNNDVLTGNKGDVRFRAVPFFKGEATDKVVVTNDEGYLRTVKAVMPKFFYMPSVMMPTMKEQASSQVTYDEVTAKFVVNLYAIYEEQFGSPKLSYNAGVEKLPVLEKDDLAFHITWFDSTVFTDVSFDDDGKLSYKVASDADVTVGSFMNIVFEVK